MAGIQGSFYRRWNRRGGDYRRRQSFPTDTMQQRVRFWLAVSLAAVAWTQFGVIYRLHNKADYSGTVEHTHEAILETADAAVPARARIWNITDGMEVSGSRIATTALTPTRVRSGVLTIPDGDKEYRSEFGS